MTNLDSIRLMFEKFLNLLLMNKVKFQKRDSSTNKTPVRQGKGLLASIAPLAGAGIKAAANAFMPGPIGNLISQGVDLIGNIFSTTLANDNGDLENVIIHRGARKDKIYRNAGQAIGAVVMIQDIQPQQVDGTRIQVLDTLYQQYRFTEVYVEYVPSVNKNISGQMMGYFSMDPDELPPGGTASIDHATAAGGVAFQIADHKVFKMPIINRGFFYTGPQDNADINTDGNKLKVQARFIVIAVTALPSNTDLGTFTLRYSCQFNIPQLRTDLSAGTPVSSLLNLSSLGYTSLGTSVYSQVKPSDYGFVGSIQTNFIGLALAGGGGYAINIPPGLWWYNLQLNVSSNVVSTNFITPAAGQFTMTSSNITFSNLSTTVIANATGSFALIGNFQISKTATAVDSDYASWQPLVGSSLTSAATITGGNIILMKYQSTVLLKQPNFHVIDAILKQNGRLIDKLTMKADMRYHNSDPPLSVFIRYPDNSIKTYMLPRDSSTDVLFRIVKKELRTDISTFRLSMSTRDIRSNCNIIDYDIGMNSTITVLMRLNGGSSVVINNPRRIARQQTTIIKRRSRSRSIKRRQAVKNKNSKLRPKSKSPNPPKKKQKLNNIKPKNKVQVQGNKRPSNRKQRRKQNKINNDVTRLLTNNLDMRPDQGDSDVGNLKMEDSSLVTNDANTHAKFKGINSDPIEEQSQLIVLPRFKKKFVPRPINSISVGEVLYYQPVSPQLMNDSRLNAKSSQYTRYKFETITVRFKPAESALNSGSLCLFYGSDPDIIPPTGTAALNYAISNGGLVFNIADEQIFPIPISKQLKPLYTGIIDSQNEGDLAKLKVQGSLYIIAASTFPVNPVGSVDLIYKIDLINPKSADINDGSNNQRNILSSQKLTSGITLTTPCLFNDIFLNEWTQIFGKVLTLQRCGSYSGFNIAGPSFSVGSYQLFLTVKQTTTTHLIVPLFYTSTPNLVVTTNTNYFTSPDSNSTLFLFLDFTVTSTGPYAEVDFVAPIITSNSFVNLATGTLIAITVIEYQRDELHFTNNDQLNFYLDKLYSQDNDVSGSTPLLSEITDDFYKV